MNRIKLLLVTNGKNSCTEYLKKRAGIDLLIVDLSIENIKTKEDLEKRILEASPDLLFVYRCPYIISPKAYSISKMGAYNIHPSLLPKYRGLNPWVEIFKNKEEENGVTLHRMTDVVDGGEILYQQSYLITKFDTIETARNKSDVIAAGLLERFLDEYIPEHKDFIFLYPLPNKFDYINAIMDKSNLLLEHETGDALTFEYENLTYFEGANCVVFKMSSRNKDFALRCWKCIGYDDCVGLCRRMKSIKEGIRGLRLSYFMEFHFYERGIITCKGIYPVMIMDWKSHPDLKQFIHKNLYDKRKLDRLADDFITMVADLHQVKMAHGDLQVSNIKVQEDGRLYLIDYDSLFVPSMSNEYDKVKGNLCFQHHSRIENKYLNPYMDYFSEYIIYFGIKALAAYPQLYVYLQLDNNEFVFTKDELYDLNNSRICNYINKKQNKELDSIYKSLLDAWETAEMNQIIPLENVLKRNDFCS